MSNLDKAKKLFQENNYTIVLVSENQTLTSTKTGIAPMLDYIKENRDLKGFAACDKIVGKAVALLFAYAGIKEVYAETISKSAFKVLEEHHIDYSYNLAVDKIINRTGDDMCPMEKTVLDINEPQEALIALDKKVQELRSKH